MVRLLLLCCTMWKQSRRTASDPGGGRFWLHVPLSNLGMNGGPPKRLYPDNIVHPCIFQTFQSFEIMGCWNKDMAPVILHPESIFYCIYCQCYFCECVIGP